MPKKAVKPDAVREIVAAALDVAAERGWDALTLPMVADAAGVTLSEITAQAADKAALLHLIFGDVDVRTREAIGESLDTAAPIKDRLFEVLMARFDVLQENRTGFLSILGDVTRDPCALVTTLPHVGHAMAEMMRLAGDPPSGVAGALRILGLTGVYLHTLRVWGGDESADLGKVMAALDADLERAQRVEAFVIR